MNLVLALRHADARLVLELALSDEPGVTVVGTASETKDLLALAQTAQPDLVLLEWDLPGRPSLEVLVAVQALIHPLRILIVSRDPAPRQRALTAGACAFVLIGDPPAFLLTVVRWERATLRH